MYADDDDIDPNWASGEEEGEIVASVTYVTVKIRDATNDTSIP